MHSKRSQIGPFVWALTLAIPLLSHCAKTPEPRPQAATPLSGLMPAGAPSSDIDALVDQATVKTLPAQAISYDPLESGGGSSAKASEKTVAHSGSAKGSKGRPPAAGPGRSAGGSFWQRVGVNALMGGGRPPAAPAGKVGSKTSDQGKAGAKAADDDEDDDDADDDSAKDKKSDSDAAKKKPAAPAGKKASIGGGKIAGGGKAAGNGKDTGKGKDGDKGKPKGKDKPKDDSSDDDSDK